MCALRLCVLAGGFIVSFVWCWIVCLRLRDLERSCCYSIKRCVRLLLHCPTNQYTILSCILLSTVTGVWSSPAVTGTKPPPLSRFSFTKVGSMRAVVYGGMTGRGPSGDVHVLELDKWVCAI